MLLRTGQDPRWTEVSASLRKGVLYVKMPRKKVVLLIQALISAEQDLLRKEILESPKAFVFYGPTDGWNEDLALLKTLPTSGVVTELVLAVEAGLRNEGRVDWLLRVGGPLPEDRATPESLIEVEDLSLLDFDEDDLVLN